MIPRLLIIISMLTVSCRQASDNWHTLDFGIFKLKAPAGWKKIENSGNNHFIEGLTNGKDTLTYYYGPDYYGPTGRESNTHLYGQDTINGLTAVIELPKKIGSATIELFIPHVVESDKFSLRGHIVASPDTMLKIFKTIVFKNSDTTKNGLLSYTKFKEYPYGSGRTLFVQYCNICHPVGNKFYDGPPITYLIKGRSDDWIYKFLTNRQFVSTDSLYKARLNEYAASCMTFDNLSMHDVEQIVEYGKAH